jgi:dephospho-CoA kinase
MLRVGLTGGIACGKSTVAAIMRELGCHVLEADPMAHQMFAAGGPAYPEVLREFGEDILGADKQIDRKKLGAVVFSNPSKLSRLNQLVHPHVIMELERQYVTLKRQNPNGIAVVEAALLAEADYAYAFDRFVVAWCWHDQQIERLQSRGFSREQAEQRISSQMPIEEKRRLATDEVNCSGTLEETRQQVVALMEKFRGMKGGLSNLRFSKE